MNIHYIRAAVQEKTGIRVELEDLKRILVEERFITPAKAKNIIFRGYGDYYDKIDIAEEVDEEIYALVDLEEDVLEEDQEEEY